MADLKRKMKQTFPVLLLGVVVTSFASILIRWTGDVQYTVIAFYRLFFSAVVLLIYHLFNRPKNKHSLHRFHRNYLLAGFFLAGHFITWIASLQLTTIGNSIFLESTHPFFAVLLSALFLKESPKLSALPYFLLALLGMLLIVSIDFDKEGTSLIGDFLAILSALFFASYLLIARIHREEPDLIRYLIYVYGTGAVFCLIYSTFSGNQLIGFPYGVWFFLILLALGPNLVGHSLLNWASRRIEIYKVNLTLLLEPVLATATGIIFIAEYPTKKFYMGAFCIILSLAYIISDKKKISYSD